MSKQLKSILMVLGLLPGLFLVLFMAAADVSRTASVNDSLALAAEQQQAFDSLRSDAHTPEQRLELMDHLVERNNEVLRERGAGELVDHMERVEQGGRAPRTNAADPAATTRVLGAYYPEDHVQEEPGPPLLALAVAGAGGLVVFLGVGAAAFLLLRPREEEPAALPEEEDDGDLVQFD